MITAVEPWSGHYDINDADMGVVRERERESYLCCAIYSCMFIAVRLPT